ncbi:MAG TPA: cytochrome c, partial [Vicinamibacterales bacterium]|nr:cytochrome c [Vicinamibacterales bacterium]
MLSKVAGAACVACALAFVGITSSVVHGQSGRTARDGVYTDAQAMRGSAIYKEQCATCHGPSLGGSLAPPLAGDSFTSTWGGPVLDIVNKIQNTMPANDFGKLTRPQATDLVAYVLQANKFPAGRADLPGDDAALKAITMPGAQVAA